MFIDCSLWSTQTKTGKPQLLYTLNCSCCLLSVCGLLLSVHRRLQLSIHGIIVAHTLLGSMRICSGFGDHSNSAQADNTHHCSAANHTTCSLSLHAQTTSVAAPVYSQLDFKEVAGLFKRLAPEQSTRSARNAAVEALLLTDSNVDRKLNHTEFQELLSK